MTNWMLWSILFATLIALSALAAERVAAHYAVPRRFIWLTAIIVGGIVPPVLAARPARPDSPQAASITTSSAPPASALDSSVSTSTTAFLVGRTAAGTRDLDVWAVRIWLVLSLAVLGTFAYATLALRRQRAGWIETDLTICRALVATDVGPAVVGFLRPRVVVPRWTLSVDEPTRHMILRHEMEHLRVRDPQALFVSGMMLIAFPWNLPLWWIVRRLRVAMELDCDARVVRTVGTLYEYGRVLLAVGERHSGSLPLAASLSGRRPLLERRISVMMMKKPRRPLVASLPFAALALVAMTSATRAPQPAPLRSLPSSRVAQPYPTREAIAAMLLANVPGLSDARDSSTYGVLVLDANNNFVTASAGYGNLVVQVWGDTLEAVDRARRTAERTGIPIVSLDASGAPGGRARSGGGGGGGARGGGGGGGDAADMAGGRDEFPSDAVRRSQWRTSSRTLFLRGPGGAPISLGGPANAYVVGLGYQRGPDPVTGAERVSPVNGAPGLHQPSQENRDDSGIDGLRASALTSLETFNLGDDLIPRHDMIVIVVTTKAAGAVR